MQQHTFEKFRSMIYQESGIVFPPEKLPLLSNRIQKRIHVLGLSDETEYLRIIEIDKSGDELIKLIDAVSTNVTYFYREPQHFEMFRSILKTLRDKKDITIWCAAASSGEEPYTLAFEVNEALGSRAQSAKILATDICTEVLQKAVVGAYPPHLVEGVSDSIRDRYMETGEDRGTPYCRVRQEIRDQILFKKLNLVRFPYPVHGPFDIIFCRNVMIYFDKDTRQKIVQEFEKLLTPGGYLFISHSENLIGMQHSLTSLGSSVYQKKVKVSD